ncbi:MAG: SRPBCC family protein [Gaiellaceae bacterium]
MSVVQRTEVVNGSLDETWAEIADLRAVEDWHPNVARVEILTDQSEGLGAARRVEFQDGNSVVETVVEESEQQFSTLKMTEMPMMKSALVTIGTEERTPATTGVTFSLDYQMKYGPIGWLISTLMMKRMFPKIFGAALAGLSYHLETGELVTDAVPDRA